VRDGAGGNSSEKAFSSQQIADADDGLLIRHEHLAIELRHVEYRRHIAVVERAQPHHGIPRQWLCCGDDDVRPALPQPRSRAHQRASCTEAGDEDVHAVERGDDLRARSVVVRPWVRLVRVLERHEERRVLLGEPLRQPHCAVRSLRARRVDDLRAVEAE
jgi:hypothetical protein